jgi:hypothetical protein
MLPAVELTLQTGVLPGLAVAAAALVPLVLLVAACFEPLIL